MEIRINNKETYNIELPEKVDADSFNTLIIRLQDINKIVSKNAFAENVFDKNKEAPLTKKTSSVIRREELKDREYVLSMVKLVYFGSKEEKTKIIKTLKFNSYDTFYATIYAVRKKFNITPNEVGLIRWPIRGESRKISTLYLDNNKNAEVKL